MYMYIYIYIFVFFNQPYLDSLASNSDQLSWCPRGSQPKPSSCEKKGTAPQDTPPETRIAPQNRPFQEEMSSANYPFSGAMFDFGGVWVWNKELSTIFWWRNQHFANLSNGRNFTSGASYFIKKHLC